jgi:hypothetical protein
MKKLLIIVVVATTLIAGGVIGYRFLSPKVIIENLSESAIEEVIVVLPTSRVAFTEIVPGGTGTIYFGLQEHGGNIQYSVRVGGVVRTGTQPYAVSGQIGRKIHIQIDPDGSVSADQ